MKTELRSFFGGRVFFDLSAAGLTTFKTGGKIQAVVFPSTEKEIEFLFSLKSVSGIRVKFLGAGSNVLVSDEGFDGIFAITGDFRGIRMEGESVVADCGVKISKFLGFALKNRFAGSEFLAGIPGTIGGALMTNAGTKDGWISNIAPGVRHMDGSGSWSESVASEIEWGYRLSSLRSSFFISRGSFRLGKGDPVVIRALIGKNVEARRKAQPLSLPSAGSVFRNPEGGFAGELIERAGLKGTRLGNAVVSGKHANFIVNLGGAASKDIYGLIKKVRERVFQAYGVKLELEVELVGGFE